MTLCRLLPLASFWVSLPLFAQVNLPLRLGMPYTEARSALVAAGWQPLNLPVSGDRQQRLQRWARDQGFTEVSACLPSGSQSCRAIFKQGPKRLLVLTSAMTQEPVTVISWSASSANP
jgi:hypothetical protein